MPRSELCRAVEVHCHRLPPVFAGSVEELSRVDSRIAEDTEDSGCITDTFDANSDVEHLNFDSAIIGRKSSTAPSHLVAFVRQIARPRVMPTGSSIPVGHQIDMVA